MDDERRIPPPGRGTDLLVGAIDLHVHTAPCLFQRPYDDAETATLAKEAGMRGVVVKDHHSPTALRAYYARKIVPGVEVFGGVALNSHVGGLSPHVVEAELKYGAKIVWMPTVTAENHLRVMGGPTFAGYDSTFRVPVEGLTVFDGNGRLKPELDIILELIRDENAVLGTGHLSIEEADALVDRARAIGVKKIVLQHVNFELPNVGPDVQKRFSDRGVILEYSYLPLTPLWFTHPPKVLAGWLHAVGPENCILVTDIGNMYNPAPPEGFRVFIESLLTAGVSEEAIRIMTHANPARLLDLE